jgi:hypothetical protein
MPISQNKTSWGSTVRCSSINGIFCLGAKDAIYGWTLANANINGLVKSLH